MEVGRDIPLSTFATRVRLRRRSLAINPYRTRRGPVRGDERTDCVDDDSEVDNIVAVVPSASAVVEIAESSLPVSSSLHADGDRRWSGEGGCSTGPSSATAASAGF